MTQEELFGKQQEYIKRIQAGERELIPELWEMLRPLTNKIINRYVFNSQGTRHYEYDDLLDLSYIALNDALESYDREKGAFSGYYFMHIQSATAHLRGRRKRRDINHETVSLSTPLNDDDDTELADMIEDPDATAQLENTEHRLYLQQLRDAFAKLERRLTQQERYVIHERYYHCRSTDSIARELNLTGSQIKTIEYSAIRKYRQKKEGIDLRQFYDYSGAYVGTGLQSYRSTGLSCVERITERHEQIRLDLEERWRREVEIQNCEHYVSYGKAQAYLNGWIDKI